MSVDELYKSFDVEEALKTTRLKPEDAGVWWTAGSVLSSYGRNAEAAAAWQRSAELTSGYDAGPAFYNAGNEFLRVPDPASAMAMYERATAAGFDAVDALLVNAASALAIQGGRSASGERDRRDAEARLGDKWFTVDQWSNLGEYFQCIVGDLERAVKYYEHAITLDPDANMGEWWHKLAELRLLLGDPDAAATAYQAGLALRQPKWLPLECDIAVAQGKGATFLERLQQAALTNAQLPQEVVKLLCALGRNGEAITYADELLSSPATQKVTRFLLLEALADEALSHNRPSEAWSRLEGLESVSDSAQFLRARALCELDRIDEAQALLEPFERQGIRASFKFRLLLAICRMRRGEAVDPAVFEDVKPLPDWFVRLKR